MKGLLCALTILVQLAAGAQERAGVQDNPGLSVINFSWSRFLQNPNALNPPFPDAPDTIGERGGQRGPYVKQADRTASKGFAYRMKIKNQRARTIKALFWEYQFGDQASARDSSRRQFACRENMKPGEVKELAVFSPSPLTHAVSVDALGDETNAGVDMKVVINRVEYTDGTVWQRANWTLPRTSSYPADLFPAQRHKSKCTGF